MIKSQMHLSQKTKKGETVWIEKEPNGTGLHLFMI